jgi:hypothetical protein
MLFPIDSNSSFPNSFTECWDVIQNIVLHSDVLASNSEFTFTDEMKVGLKK